MAKAKKEKTLDNETFKWIEEQNPKRCLKCARAKLDWESKPMRITCPKNGNPLKAWGDLCSDKKGRPPEADNRRRQRYFSIRNVAHKEIDDLTKLIEVLPDKQANQIFIADHLKGLISALLGGPMGEHFPDRAKLYLERARIAQLFIEYGFDYLSSMNSSMMTDAHKDAMVAAIDLSRFLLEHFPSEWPYYPEVHGTSRQD